MEKISESGNSGLISQEAVFEDAKYSIIKEGSLSYIVNNDGVKVSNGYDEIFPISHENIKVLIGKRGSQRYMLKIPEKYEDFIDESPEGFHEIFYNKKIGHWVGESGAMTYILDMKTGNPVTKGYHNITGSGTRLYGEIGATREEIFLITSLPETFHKIFFNEEIGYWVGKLGAMTYILDAVTRKPVTKGYHTITQSGGVLYGERGASREKVLFISDLNYEDEGEYGVRGDDISKLNSSVQSKVKEVIFKA